MGRTARDIALLQFREETLRKVFTVMHKIFLTEEGRRAHMIAIQTLNTDGQYENIEHSKQTWTWHLQGLFLSIVETDLEDGV